MKSEFQFIYETIDACNKYGYIYELVRFLKGLPDYQRIYVPAIINKLKSDRIVNGFEKYIYNKD
jgi:hypothetical protein